VWQRFRFWRERLGLPVDVKIVEAGCGYGKFSLVMGLAGARVTLMDFNPSAVEAAREAHHSLGLSSTAIQGDILDPPAELQGKFDVACSFGTLEHFSGEHRLKALQANARLVRPGGVLFFVVPNRHGVFYRLAIGLRQRLGLLPEDFYEEPFSRKELSRLAAASGIELLELDCCGTLGDDFQYWIWGNCKSLFRRLVRLRKPVAAAVDPPDHRKLDLNQAIPDRRRWFDRRFSAGWLLVGRMPDSAKT
jgi:SAM-dependent methyltransferase